MHMLKTKKVFIFALVLVFVFCIASVTIFYWKNIKSLNLPFEKQKASSLDDIIQVVVPKPNEKISSPLVVAGEARGPWYFEAVFPIVVLDEKGNEIARTQGRALSEWTTDAFVPFRAELKFLLPTGKYGTLVLEKDNPFGNSVELAPHAQELRIPVQFY